MDLKEIEHIIATAPPAVVGPAAFVVWLITLWAVKRFLFFRLRKWAESTRATWDDAFIGIVASALNLPLDLLIVSSGVMVLTGLSGMSDRYVAIAKAVFQGCVVLTCVLAADRLLRLAVHRFAAKGALGNMSLGVVQGLIRGFVIGIGILIFLDLLGISITPLLASLGIGSLAVALALQDTLGNFFSGLYISVDRPVAPGDFVKLESGQEGYVTDVGWRNTRIRLLSNDTVIIPNTKLIGSTITNYYLPAKETAVLMQVGVHYDSDMDKVERVVSEVGNEVMRTVQGGVPEFKTFIRFHTLGEYSVNFTVILRAKEFTDNYLIKHEFIKRLNARFKKEGIIIPYPTRTVLKEE
jgi:small-conductance mechanosensitive channel